MAPSPDWIRILVDIQRPYCSPLLLLVHHRIDHCFRRDLVGIHLGSYIHDHVIFYHHRMLHCIQTNMSMENIHILVDRHLKMMMKNVALLFVTKMLQWYMWQNLPIWQGDSSVKAPGHPSSISSGKVHILSDIFSLQFRSRGLTPPPQVTLHGVGSSHPVHSHFGSPLHVSHSSRSPQPQSGFSRSQSPSQSR